MIYFFGQRWLTPYNKNGPYAYGSAEQGLHKGAPWVTVCRIVGFVGIINSVSKERIAQALFQIMASKILTLMMMKQAY